MRFLKSALLLICLSSSAVLSSSSSTANPPFSDQELSKIVGYFLDNFNIGGLGGIAAGTSRINPKYFYHWSRDAAISMNIMADVVSDQQAIDLFQHYKDFEYGILQGKLKNCNHGVDIRGDPKFNLDGSCFNDSWTRPQNDAAGLRAIAMIRYASILTKVGKKDQVLNNLYIFDATKPSIKSDLNYAAQIWNQVTGDPWEEVKGQCLFQKLASRKALIEGAVLADSLGDHSAASQYRSVVKLIESDITMNHWNQSSKILMEVPFIRELDSATHLAILYGDTSDGFLSSSSDRVQSSVAVLINSFKNYYPINIKDSSANVPGVLVGRYLYDVYSGGNPHQPDGANPWILCSASLSDVFYRAAKSYLAQGTIQITSLNLEFWNVAIDLSNSNGFNSGLSVHAGDKISSSDPRFSKAISVLIQSGDSILNRIRYHIFGNDFHMTEQINKDSGFAQGSNDLTWSYGTVISAMQSRSSALSGITLE
jgi:glucoamylase